METLLWLSHDYEKKAAIVRNIVAIKKLNDSYEK